jgi:hypothetical protein
MLVPRAPIGNCTTSSSTNTLLKRRSVNITVIDMQIISKEKYEMCGAARTQLVPVFGLDHTFSKYSVLPVSVKTDGKRLCVLSNKSWVPASWGRFNASVA